jgi:hypothetical protein
MTRALIAKVHIAKKELALADESYRAILERITGRASSKDCSERQLEQLIAEFKRLGWVPRKAANPPSAKPWVRKIYALWRDAGIVGAVDNASKAALRAFVKRQTGKSAPEFCSPSEANKVSEGLKAMIRRAEERG